VTPALHRSWETLQENLPRGPGSDTSAEERSRELAIDLAIYGLLHSVAACERYLLDPPTRHGADDVLSAAWEDLCQGIDLDGDALRLAADLWGEDPPPTTHERAIALLATATLSPGPRGALIRALSTAT